MDVCLCINQLLIHFKYIFFFMYLFLHSFYTLNAKSYLSSLSNSGSPLLPVRSERRHHYQTIFYWIYFSIKSLCPNVGHEPMTLRLRVSLGCSPLTLLADHWGQYSLWPYISVFPLHLDWNLQVTNLNKWLFWVSAFDYIFFQKFRLWTKHEITCLLCLTNKPHAAEK